MKKFLNVRDILIIAVFSYSFIWLVNKALNSFGLSQFAATPAKQSQ